MGKHHFSEIDGGLDTVSEIIREFMSRVYADTMIGYHFRAADKEAVIQREFELAARFLGADIPYSGRALGRVHRPHRIVGGHFMRRLKLLDDVLREYRIPDALRVDWISHNESLRKMVTSDQGSDCDHEGAEVFAQGSPIENKSEAPDS